MATDGYSVRNGTADDWQNAVELLWEAFGEDADPAAIEMDELVAEPERLVMVTFDDEVAGTSAAFTRNLTVPGGVVAAAHVTGVGVRPTHRRRGVLTRMMRHQLADVTARGEPVAVLWASEGRIYQRYGYGLAAQRLTLDVSREVTLNDPPGQGEGRLRTIEPETVQDVIAKVYEQVRTDRVGWSSRDERWWAHLLTDPASRRNGATARRVTVHEGQSGVDGYAMWRVKQDWDSGGAKGAVQVRELVALNPEAYQALWRLLLSVDLTRTTQWYFAATDEPLQYLVNEPRRLGAAVGDALWVRLVDVPAALAARRYATPVDVVLDVTDPVLPVNTGRYHLVGGPAGATCTRTDREPDLACAVGALGAAYLGGTSLAGLAAGGRVEERHPGSLVPASLAFGWHRAPSTTEIF